MPTLNITKFDPKSIKPHSIIMVIGKRGSGKTSVMRDLLYNMKNRLDFGIAMCPTDAMNNAFSSILPSALVYNGFDEHVMAFMKFD